MPNAARRAILTLLALAAVPLAVQAQEGAPRVAPLPRVGDVQDERIRLDELLGRRTPGSLFQSPSVLVEELPADSLNPVALQFIAPEVRSTWNSDIPLSLNNGSLWAGRGLSSQLLAGVRVRLGSLHAIVAPQWSRIGNGEFVIDPQDILHSPVGQSVFRAPWRREGLPIDIPIRFGAEPFRQLEAGQSTLWVTAGPADLGFTTEEAWWGPGIRNGLILSTNAPGVPRVFARTRAPVTTRYGAFDAHLASGILTESLYFDTLPRNDQRTFNALGLSYAPHPSLTLGVTRSLVDRLPDTSDVFEKGAKLLAWSPGDAIQILGLFARWLLPREGAEVYGEWAYHNAPGTLSELIAPINQTASYTLGLQWAKPLSSDSMHLLRLGAEVSNLEHRVPPGRADSLGYAYTSDEVAQGYTQRGRSLGAAIGPGSSSQYVGADWFAPKWIVGASFMRVRWDTDGFLTTGPQTVFFAHDISLIASLRASADVRGVRVTAEYFRENRLNYLFRNAWQGDELVGNDIVNHGLRLGVTMTPRPYRAPPEPEPTFPATEVRPTDSSPGESRRP